jgi:DNA-directed RNA polymerase sigma subunit (sigma70/sigma32)
MVTLTRREREVLRRRFALGGGEPASLVELGEYLGGMDAKSVSTLEARALSKLRHPSTAHRLTAHEDAA